MLGTRPVSTSHSTESIADGFVAKPKPDEKSDAGGSALLWTLFKMFRGSLFFNAIPRLLLIVARYAQPFLISATIEYVTTPVTENSGSNWHGYQLILATLALYVSSAALYCICGQGHNRMRVQSRGALIGLIHVHCLTMCDGIYDDAAALSHMSADTDRVETFSWMCQEVWALLVELLIGMALLWSQLGWWCLTPLLTVILCSRVAKWLES